jgi:hypothetical protein
MKLEWISSVTDEAKRLKAGRKADSIKETKQEFYRFGDEIRRLAGGIRNSSKFFGNAADFGWSRSFF